VKGLMQEVPLTLPLVLRRAARDSATREVVAAPDSRTTWGEIAGRSFRLARALDRLGVARGERVASFAWNSHRHVELYLGVPGSGRVLHTANVRLHQDQLAWMIDHAEDRVVFVDSSLTPLLEPIRDRLRGVRTFVVLEDGPEPAPAFADDPRYEELLAQESGDDFDFPEIEESDAASICYTSGTTGYPKAVVYSHRSVLLHTMATLMVDNHGVSAEETFLLVTPMFHVNGWGIPYSAAFAGAKLVLPGKNTEPDHIGRLVERERATVSCAVTTVWARFIDVVEAGTYDVSSLKRILIGGMPIAESLVARYAEHGIEIRLAWGMTEMSPTGTMSRPSTRTEQGGAIPGVEVRICDESGDELPWDGESIGEVEVRGPWVARAYLKPDDDCNTTRFHDGWLRTGDVGTITPDGLFSIVDRTKDLVKSGGEWISSIELEEHLAAHADVIEVAVVARADDEWGERPVALVVLRAGAEATPDELADYLRPRVAKWWVPDEIEVVDELPKTSVGKIDKRRLRQLVAEHGRKETAR
jgi:acyl-CoA synthetase (AMP-forming)/AMP-acid ligase II